MGRTVHQEHTGIRYTWEDVPEDVYQNVLTINRKEFDKSDFSVKGIPYSIQIEPTNICNMKCPFCPASNEEALKRKLRHMTFDEFKTIIDKFGKYLMFIVMWNWGEPFMNPELPKMFKYASGKGIKMATSTNANFLNNEEYVKDVLNSGLTTLIVAIDSVDKESYKAYRKKGNISKALEGLKNLCRLKKEMKSRTGICLQMVLMKHNENQIPIMKKLAKDLGVDYFIVKTVNPNCGMGTADETIVPTNPKLRRFEYKKGTFEKVRAQKECMRAWTTLSILSNGDVTPCGHDYECRWNVGNLIEDSLQDVWNSKKIKEFRRKIYKSENLLPGCERCATMFKLSKTGWFPVSIDYSMGFTDKIAYKARRYYSDSPKLQKIRWMFKK